MVILVALLTSTNGTRSQEFRQVCTEKIGPTNFSSSQHSYSPMQRLFRNRRADQTPDDGVPRMMIFDCILNSFIIFNFAIICSGWRCTQVKKKNGRSFSWGYFTGGGGIATVYLNVYLWHDMLPCVQLNKFDFPIWFDSIIKSHPSCCTGNDIERNKFIQLSEIIVGAPCLGDCLQYKISWTLSESFSEGVSNDERGEELY